MELINDPKAAAAWSAEQRRRGRSVGLVPTMGALHEGHLVLVQRALEGCGAVAASIFVNPLQFNDLDDLRLYPRQVEADQRMLEKVGCRMVFIPTETEVFKEHAVGSYDLAGLDKVLEGASRPGHFQGVVNVVERLFHHVRPDRAYFGEKDRQQLAVIRHVARELHWPEEIVPCATVRASDGLALSSRNQRLTTEERRKAPILFQSLKVIEAHAFNTPVAETLSAGRRWLDAEPALRTDYLEIVDPVTLRPLHSWGSLNEAIALAAIRLGEVRLIDNIILRR